MRPPSTKKMRGFAEFAAAVTLLAASQFSSADPLSDQLDQLEEIILEQIDDCSSQHLRKQVGQNSPLTSILNWTRDTPPVNCAEAGLDRYSRKLMELADRVDSRQPDQLYRETLDKLTKRLWVFGAQLGIQEARQSESAAFYTTLTKQGATTTSATGSSPDGYGTPKGYTAISGK
jgi:hypothetical protein